jgi:hypothetical protein
MGTMRQADNKANKIFVIGAAIVIGLVALCVYVLPTDLHAFFKATKSFTKWFSLLVFASAFYMVYKAHDAFVNEKSSGSYWIAVLVLIAFAIGLACGFNFDYFRLGK